MSKLRLYPKVARLFLGGHIVAGEDIANSYSLVSPGYEQWFLNTMHRYNDEMIGELSKHLDPSQSLQILDLAAGTGYNAQAMQGLFPASRLTLVDISPGMLKEARQNLGEDVSLITSDMLNYLANCADNTFDVVICAWAIKYRNPLQVIRHCHRVLKPGGYLAVIVNTKDTLPQVARIYPQLLARHVPKITKLMLPLPNPRDLAAFDGWFRKYSFTKIKSQKGFQDFIFPTSRELAEFIVSTGALAGFDVMLDLRDPAVFADLVQLLADHHFTGTTHRYVYGIYQKLSCSQRNLRRRKANE
ncbi:ubiquinone/menaquinone biosynthesis C-methylase UbiE [Desulfitobacterium sp. LBE]|uniref:class I SAM-dependent methyltransferase n=1 Tax=Desulfitobacterium TaxID=36853 RepID=UPI000362D282|nr:MULTISPECIES: class I SAM-dependent methyltransferase [Desulfitobacterium]TWH57328.1 ubiquinone/menaquinone biosynthesis C-methylase UbiE [Desulfitobacterium sp. LBE]